MTPEELSGLKTQSITAVHYRGGNKLIDRLAVVNMSTAIKCGGTEERNDL